MRRRRGCPPTITSGAAVLHSKRRPRVILLCPVAHTILRLPFTCLAFALHSSHRISHTPVLLELASKPTHTNNAESRRPFPFPPPTSLLFYDKPLLCSLTTMSYPRSANDFLHLCFFSCTRPLWDSPPPPPLISLLNPSWHIPYPPRLFDSTPFPSSRNLFPAR